MTFFRLDVTLLRLDVTLHVTPHVVSGLKTGSDHDVA